MMTPLRQQMIGAMRQRGFSVRTHESYLTAVRDLARYYRRSPDEITVDELQGFFDHLARERNLSAASCRLYLNGIRFLYLQVLQWESFDVQLIVPKRPQRIPELLTRQEVHQAAARMMTHLTRSLELCHYIMREDIYPTRRRRLTSACSRTKCPLRVHFVADAGR